MSGRPEIEIDWKKVDFLLEADCTGTEVAAQLGIHPDTLYNRIVSKYGESFTDYSAKKKQKGESNLRAAQYQKALKGDNHMLIWLGKNRLKQRDKEETNSNQPTNIIIQVPNDLASGSKLQA